MLGSLERELVEKMYKEGWRQKIETKSPPPSDFMRESKLGTYVNPVVTVALRPDGNVESVVFNRESGVPHIDHAVKRIIYMLSPYDRLPAEVAPEGVIEIQYVWTMDKAVRLFSSGR